MFLLEQDFNRSQTRESLNIRRTSSLQGMNQPPLTVRLRGSRHPSSLGTGMVSRSARPTRTLCPIACSCRVDSSSFSG